MSGPADMPDEPCMVWTSIDGVRYHIPVPPTSSPLAHYWTFGYTDFLCGRTGPPGGRYSGATIEALKMWQEGWITAMQEVLYNIPLDGGSRESDLVIHVNNEMLYKLGKSMVEVEK